MTEAVTERVGRPGSGPPGTSCGSGASGRSGATAPRPVTTSKPTLRVERGLMREGHRILAGMDEVGRGALAGPVSVGVVLIDATCRSAPKGVRDSKLLAPARREQLVRPVQRWALAWGVGHATPEEIDTWGIMTGLRLAGRRALKAAGLVPDLVILDGNHDWLSDPGQDVLFALPPSGPELATEPGGPASEPDELRHATGFLGRTPPELESVPSVRTVIKGDRSCSSVAAASILAKVERDAMLVERAPEFPEYCWELNKGYAAPEHLAAIAAHGPCPWHRRSWRLPGAATVPEPTVGSALETNPDHGPVSLTGAAATVEAPLATLIDAAPVLVSRPMGDDDQMEVCTS